MKKTICIAGKNNIAVDVLDYCLKRYKDFDDMQVVAVLTRNDKGINSWQRSFKWFCEKEKVKIITLEDAYEIENLLFLSVEFDRIIKTAKFKSDKLFNIHFSLLPEYKGMYPSVFPILHNKKHSGVTLHRIRDGIDTGEIIKQQSFAIEESDTSLDIYKKLINSGTDMAISNIENLLNDKFTCRQQEARYSTYFSANTIDYANLVLDIKCTAYQIQNQVRAFAFRPYQLLEFNNCRIVEAKITNDASKVKPGTVIEEADISIKISSIDYDIILYKDVLAELLDSITIKNIDRAKYLCASSKIINDQNEHGWSPLTVAVYNNNLEMVKYLLERGADKNVLNVNGTNLLMYAKDCYLKYKDSTIFEYLLVQGVSPDQTDYSGKNLYDYCREKNIMRIGDFIVNF